MVDFRELFQNVGQQPGMYVLSDKYLVLVAFVVGCDMATGRRLLDGFQDWVAARTPAIRGRSSLVWGTLIASRHYPELLNGGSIADLPAAARDLFGMLDLFLSERGEPSAHAS